MGILRQERSPRVECFVIEKTGGRLWLYMKYPLRFAVAALICHASLFASGISAELSKGSAAALAVVGGQAIGAIGYHLHPHCTEKNSAPDCISVPQVVSSPQPTYSEEARKAKLEGNVVLVLIVDEKGNPTKVSVVNSLGMGLNEKAIEAVKGWKFTPAFGKDGKPVAAKIAVEVDFHL
jgi:TonB family protein